MNEWFLGLYNLPTYQHGQISCNLSESIFFISQIGVVTPKAVRRTI